ncbi:hypothetical protein QE152_g24536 [Popillia japonica]|uniref:Uncharacterized protein n=1 Tax=Popillia japonica TaxID=7064 RepID=A0AAW1KF82_POPJA
MGNGDWTDDQRQEFLRALQEFPELFEEGGAVATTATVRGRRSRRNHSHGATHHTTEGRDPSSSPPVPILPRKEEDHRRALYKFN